MLQPRHRTRSVAVAPRAPRPRTVHDRVLGQLHQRGGPRRHARRGGGRAAALARDGDRPALPDAPRRAVRQRLRRRAALAGRPGPNRLLGSAHIRHAALDADRARPVRTRRRPPVERSRPRHRRRQRVVPADGRDTDDGDERRASRGGVRQGRSCRYAPARRWDRGRCSPGQFSRTSTATASTSSS